MSSVRNPSPDISLDLSPRGPREDRDRPREIRDLPRGSRGRTANVVRSLLVVLSLSALTACSSTTEPITEEPPPPQASEPPAPMTAVDAAAPIDAAEDATPKAPEITAAAILAKLDACKKVSKAPYAKDASGTANIDVCELGDAVYWTADLDVDCDGLRSDVCNEKTDPSFQAQTATKDSKGKYLDAASLPYVVVPGPSSRWDYSDSDVAMGSVALVIYQGKLAYGIVGDVGPAGIIGEASYAMAKQLGINPDPKRGGTSSGVTYIVFAGKSALVSRKEDNAEAVLKGIALATQLLTK